MAQQEKDQQMDFTTNKGAAGKGAADAEMGKDQQPEGGKNKQAEGETGTHDEGQYQEGNDKATMSPGSSEAEVNPSAKDRD